MKIRIGPNYEVENDRLYSTIYFEFENGLYPCEGWQDFVVTCLTCWYIAIRKCKKNHKTYLMFFDGDERLALRKGEYGDATLSFHDEATHADIQYDIRIDDLIGKILNACTDILKVAQRDRICCKDLDGLEIWVARRKRYLR